MADRGYRCSVCNRPAARYNIKQFSVLIDMCDGCGYYVVTQQWDQIGARYNASGLATARPPVEPYPMPEPAPYPV